MLVSRRVCVCIYYERKNAVVVCRRAVELHTDKYFIVAQNWLIHKYNNNKYEFVRTSTTHTSTLHTTMKKIH